MGNMRVKLLSVGLIPRVYAVIFHIRIYPHAVYTSLIVWPPILACVCFVSAFTQCNVDSTEQCGLEFMKTKVV